MPAVATQEQQMSPIEKLNDIFITQNDRLMTLVERLRNKLHQLSDTNNPKNEAAIEQKTAQLPFNEGHLMRYFGNLQRNNSLLDYLNDEVNKIEGLI